MILTKSTRARHLSNLSNFVGPVMARGKCRRYDGVNKRMVQQNIARMATNMLSPSGSSCLVLH